MLLGISRHTTKKTYWKIEAYETEIYDQSKCDSTEHQPPNDVKQITYI